MDKNYSKQHYLNVLKHRGYVRHVVNTITHDLQTRSQHHDKASTELEQEELNARNLELSETVLAGIVVQEGYDTEVSSEWVSNSRRLEEIHNKTEEHHLEYFDSDIAKMNAVQLIMFLADQYAEYCDEIPSKSITFVNYIELKFSHLELSEDLDCLIGNTAEYIEENT